jgi:hypothetical protein
MNNRTNWLAGLVLLVAVIAAVLLLQSNSAGRIRSSVRYIRYKRMGPQPQPGKETQNHLP